MKNLVYRNYLLRCTIYDFSYQKKFQNPTALGAVGNLFEWRNVVQQIFVGTV